LKSFDFEFFVGDVKIEVGLGFLALANGPWAPTPRANF